MAELDLSDKTVYILGNGPSLEDGLSVLLDRLDIFSNHSVIAINDSIYRYPCADILFFRDVDWYLANRMEAETHHGSVFTTSMSKFYSSKINVLETRHCKEFLVGGPLIRYGRSSGHLAVSFAINRGAKRIVLLGYDCQDDRPYYKLLYKTDFLPAWQGWGIAARRAGVEIVNTATESVIMEFTRRPLFEVVEECH